MESISSPTHTIKLSKQNQLLIINHNKVDYHKIELIARISSEKPVGRRLRQWWILNSINEINYSNLAVVVDTTIERGQLEADILRNYQTTTKILLRHYQDTTKILLKYYQDTT